MINVTFTSELLRAFKRIINGILVWVIELLNLELYSSIEVAYNII